MTAKKKVTVEDLLAKTRKSRKVKIGDMEVTIQAIGSKAYDDLVGEHPPAKGSKDDTWNTSTFPPALIAASMADPVMTVEQAEELWTSESWSRGELGGLFSAIVKLNVEGIDVPFSEPG